MSFFKKKVIIPTVWKIYENNVPVETADNIQTAYYRLKSRIASKANARLKESLIEALDISYAAQIQKGIKADLLTCGSGTFHAKRVRAD